VYRCLEARARDGVVVFWDRFVPRPSDPALADRWRGSYVNNWRYFADASPDWFATYAGHAQVYLGNRPDYVNIWTTDAGASEQFYQAFAGKDRVTSPDGRTLTLRETFGCGWQVWRVE
jgi:hypothetical protein